ncbi:MAG: DUF4440 domain-containing protein [Pontiellaceae bacterium]|nr:DUF4440 domain-containing protein [Pontiellaceae bacterium]
MKTAEQIYWVLCVMCLSMSLGCAGRKPHIVLEALSANQEQMRQSFIDQDADAFVSCWAPNIICMVDELPIIQGSEPLRAVFSEAAGNPDTHNLKRLNRQFWMSGATIYETGVYTFGGANAKTFVTVWSQQPDSSWTRAVEIWSDRAFPSAEQLDEWSQQTPEQLPFVEMKGGSTAGMDAILSRLEVLEQEFHHYFLSDNAEPAVDVYADDARLFSAESGWLVGSEAIRKQIMNSAEQSTLVDIERKTIRAGGDDQMIYMVNQFHWQLKMPSTGEQIHDFYGKGLHVWQRQPDGQWKILIDINNTNPPPGATL